MSLDWVCISTCPLSYSFYWYSTCRGCYIGSSPNTKVGSSSRSVNWAPVRWQETSNRRGQNVGWLKRTCLWGFKMMGNHEKIALIIGILCESKLIFTGMLYVYNSILYYYTVRLHFVINHHLSALYHLLSICTCFGIRISLGWLSINPEAQPELRLDDANGSCWESWKVKRHVGVPTKLIKHMVNIIWW